RPARSSDRNTTAIRQNALAAERGPAGPAGFPDREVPLAVRDQGPAARRDAEAGPGLLATRPVAHRDSRTAVRIGPQEAVLWTDPSGPADAGLDPGGGQHHGAPAGRFHAATLR